MVVVTWYAKAQLIMSIAGGGVSGGGGCISWCGAVPCLHQFAAMKPMEAKTERVYFAICTIAELLQKEKWQACSL